MWTAIDLTGGNPYPSVADVLYVAGYPLLAVGLGLLLWSGIRRVDWGDLVDVAIVTLASLLVLWPIVFQPALNEGWSWTTLTGISYSTGDVLLLGLLAALFFHGERRSPVIWLTAASLVLVFAGRPRLLRADVRGHRDRANLVGLHLARRLRPDRCGRHPPRRAPEPKVVGCDRVLAAATAPLRRHRSLDDADRFRRRSTSPGTGSTDWRASVAINGAVAALVVLRLRILLTQVDGARRDASTAMDRFETVFETAGLGISITENGRLMRTNPTFQRLVGYNGEHRCGCSRRPSLADPSHSGRRRAARCVHCQGSIRDRVRDCGPRDQHHRERPADAHQPHLPATRRLHRRTSWRP